MGRNVSKVCHSPDILINSHNISKKLQFLNQSFHISVSKTQPGTIVLWTFIAEWIELSGEHCMLDMFMSLQNGIISNR